MTEPHHLTGWQRTPDEQAALLDEDNRRRILDRLRGRDVDPDLTARAAATAAHFVEDQP